MTGMKSTVRLNQRSLDIIERKAASSYRTRTQILNDALWYYSELDSYMQEAVSSAVQATWERRNEEIRRIVTEVLAEELPRILLTIRDNGMANCHIKNLNSDTIK